MTRIGLIGAGNIAAIHADVVRGLKGRRVSAIIDPNRDAAERLARRIGGEVAQFADVAEALAAAAFDRAHVLTPPDHHVAAAAAVLETGRAVLVEKPLAVDAAGCAWLREAAIAGAAIGAVNQNFIHHPAFSRLRARLASGAFGPARAVRCVYRMPLRQLAARQFGAWMFRAPVNLLLEQAVHPLSQLFILAGAPTRIAALAGPATEIGVDADGMPARIFPQVDVSLSGDGPPAQLHFALGAEFPEWRLEVACDDGVLSADMLANRCQARGRTRFLDLLDAPLSATAEAARQFSGATRHAAAQALGLAGLGADADPFRASMRGAIAAFHEAVDGGRAPETDLAFGASLVTACEEIAAQACPAPAPAIISPAMETPSGDPIAVLGGTGFIGQHLVRQALAEGRAVSVLARSIAPLPALFRDPRIRLTQGSITDADAVGRAIAGCDVVVNLAHGGGRDFAALRAAMLGGAETVARVCLGQGVRQLIHVGSIAALYLGPGKHKVTGATAPDPQAESRADYARAKALCDARLLQMHAEEGLPLTILRPGVVVGEGGPAWHSGVAFHNNSQHWLGWNAGTNPLPFVLVEDVASAILLAAAKPGSIGQCFNLVGDVRWSARRYVAELAAVLGRPLRYHPQSPTKLWLAEIGKYLVKRAAGRRPALPSRRDLLSRGMMARFDCTDAKSALGWRPEEDEAKFRARAILVHAPPP